MREIKFRAWSSKDNKMTYWDLHSLTGLYNDIWDYIDEDSIMQFTGLKDKNGKEIYEGDILRFEFYGGIAIVKIEWMDKYAQFEFFDNREEVCPITDYTDMMGFELSAEVIGDIYENKELLEAK